MWDRLTQMMVAVVFLVFLVGSFTGCEGCGGQTSILHQETGGLRLLGAEPQKNLLLFRSGAGEYVETPSVPSMCYEYDYVPLARRGVDRVTCRMVWCKWVGSGVSGGLTTLWCTNQGSLSKEL